MRLRAICLLLAAVGAGVATAAVAEAAKPAPKVRPPAGAAWPKGAYSRLDALPDWGGVWVLARPMPPAAGAPPREQPVLKGEYLARYQAWQKQVRDNNGLVPREIGRAHV